MIKIALTGGIACGKSLAGEMMRARGVPVCETDEIGHEILEQDESVKAALIKEFGTAVVSANGQIDRAALGNCVFADPERRLALNRLTHPVILKRLDDWVVRQAATADCVIAIIPLLYEIGAEKAWDKVICLGAPAAEQLSRLTGRGLSQEDALARIGAQMSQAEKLERADFVIYNCGSKSLLEKQVNQVLRIIRGE
ncbi:MAG: dephospho-CoA kinase [bacterium]